MSYDWRYFDTLNEWITEQWAHSNAHQKRQRKRWLHVCKRVWPHGTSRIGRRFWLHAVDRLQFAEFVDLLSSRFMRLLSVYFGVSIYRSKVYIACKRIEMLISSLNETWNISSGNRTWVSNVFHMHLKVFFLYFSSTIDMFYEQIYRSHTISILICPSVLCSELNLIEKRHYQIGRNWIGFPFHQMCIFLLLFVLFGRVSKTVLCE